MKLGKILADGMAFEVLVAGLLAFLFPQQIGSVLRVSLVPWLLGIVMFGMGLTLRARDFLPVLTHPRDVLLGFLLQFTIMPLVAAGLVHVLRLPPELALGVILVGCAPGGTASNVVTYLARGDVALSVAMTSCSTLCAPLVTPFLVWLFAGQSVPVDALQMAVSTAQVVLLPIALGIAANEFFPKICTRITKGTPAFSSVVVAVIVAAVVSVNAVKIQQNFGLVLVAVVLHNVFGMGLGWGIACLCRLTPARRRTVAVEVGMQNSGLAVSLAQIHFAAMPFATVPGALFSVWHNISGSIFAAVCRCFAKDLKPASRVCGKAR